MRARDGMARTQTRSISPLYLLRALIRCVLLLSSSAAKALHFSALDSIDPSSPQLPVPAEPTVHPVALEVLWDGTVSARDTQTNETRWSFFSGAPLSSAAGLLLESTSTSSESSNASSGITTDPVIADDEYLFCGTDWRLYSFEKRFGTEGLPVSPEDLVRNTPVILEDSLIIGTMSTSAFLLDSKSGTLVRTFGYNHSPPAADNVKVKDDLAEYIEGNFESMKSNDHVYVLRKDYVLKSVATASGVVLWNVSIADVRLHHISSGDFPHLPYAEEMNAEGRIVPFDALRKSVGQLGHHIEDQTSEKHSQLALPERSNGVVQALPHGSQDHTQEYSPVHRYFAFMRSYKPILLLGCFIPLLLLKLIHKEEPSDPAKEPGSGKKKKRKPKQNSTEKFLLQPHHEKRLSDSMSTVRSNHSGAGQGVATPGSKHGNACLICSLPVEDGHDHGDLRVVGNLAYEAGKVIGHGSLGTVVYEGYLAKRKVAVKRLLCEFHEKAEKEISHLIASDEHPNIVRYFGMHRDADFVYVALERCSFSLYDLVITQSAHCLRTSRSCSPLELSTMEYSSLKVGGASGDALWDEMARPSPKLLQYMRDILAGLSHLHDIDIVHRDLKPQNVLISDGRLSLAKLSDMGISKRLVDGASTYGNTSPGAGSSGWQAPEQLRQERQTKSVDLFSLGCVLFFCVSGGHHPFGQFFERDKNILDMEPDRFPDLFAVSHVPEAEDLLRKLLSANPQKRPSVKEAMAHPLLWNSEKRLTFLQDASDRLEMEGKESQSELIKDLEDLLQGRTWDQKLDTALLEDIKQKRRYNYNSVRDLLRVIRNKKAHYRELPQVLQQLFASYPEGFDNYFRNKYPRLLLEVYEVLSKHCRHEDLFKTHYISS